MNKQVTTCHKTGNPYAYASMMFLALFLFIKGDYTWAFTNLGIAMVFYPFDTKVKGNNRPFFQKAWLLIHLVITVTALLIMWLIKN